MELDNSFLTVILSIIKTPPVVFLVFALAILGWAYSVSLYEDVEKIKKENQELKQRLGRS